jgi:hypothetical protein
MNPTEEEILESGNYRAFPIHFSRKIAEFLMKRGLIDAVCYMTKNCQIMEVYENIDIAFFSWWANLVKDRVEELKWIFEFSIILSKIDTKFLEGLLSREDRDQTIVALREIIVEIRLPRQAVELLVREYSEVFSAVPRWSITVYSFKKVVRLLTDAGVADRVTPLSVCQRRKTAKKTSQLIERGLKSSIDFRDALKLDDLATIILDRPTEEWPIPKMAKDEKKARYLLFCVVSVIALKGTRIPLKLFEAVLTLSRNEDGTYLQPKLLRGLVELKLCESDKPQATELLQLYGI